jgi:DNA-binding transcriptional regulator YiaG
MTNEDRLWKMVKELKETKIDFSKKDKDSKAKQRGIIAGKIKAYRVEHNMTQAELANKLGVPKLQIIRWEGSGNLPNSLAKSKLKEVGIL